MVLKTAISETVLMSNNENCWEQDLLKAGLIAVSCSHELRPRGRMIFGLRGESQICRYLEIYRPVSARKKTADQRVTRSECTIFTDRGAVDFYVNRRAHFSRESTRPQARLRTKRVAADVIYWSRGSSSGERSVCFGVNGHNLLPAQ